MLIRLLSSLNCLASLVKPARGAPLRAAADAAPLDHVERLHRQGSPQRVLMELPRLGW